MNGSTVKLTDGEASRTIHVSESASDTRQDYSPPWGHWLDSFELAKHHALVEVEEGMNELAEIHHEHKQREAS